jgi:predicted dehydrogenase
VVTRETEDAFAAVVRLDDGSRALVGGSRATAGRSGAIELAGRDGQLVGDHVHGHAARLLGATRTALEVGDPIPTVPAALHEMAAALAAGRAPAITLADGAAAVALAEACYRSIASGNVETVERP